MKYLVKHDTADYRLHAEDGAETGDAWSWESDWLTDRTEEMVSAVDNASGSDKVRYRDVTLDGESVPWNTE